MWLVYSFINRYSRGPGGRRKEAVKGKTQSQHSESLKKLAVRRLFVSSFVSRMVCFSTTSNWDFHLYLNDFSTDLLRQEISAPDEFHNAQIKNNKCLSVSLFYIRRVSLK